MSTKYQDKQKFLRFYKQQTGKHEINMIEVAELAIKNGWKVPPPKSDVERLAKEFSEAAREETRVDKKSGRPYRVNHAYTTSQGSEQLTLWVDIDEAPRKPMLKALMKRRDQTVGDVLQMTFDAEHWNTIHPEESPILLPLDFTPDVEWRKSENEPAA